MGPASYAAAKRYQQTKIQSASPGELILMLYDGALRFTAKAVEALGRGDLPQAHAQAVRAQDIVLELMSALNHDAGDVAGNLQRLYDFIYRRLLDGNLHKEVTPFEEARALLQELRDTWETALRQLAASQPAGLGSSTARVMGGRV